MPMGPTLVDKTTGMQVLVHWPMSSYQNSGGAAYPQVMQNELQEAVGFGTYYPLDQLCYSNGYYKMAITNFRDQSWWHKTFDPYAVVAHLERSAENGLNVLDTHKWGVQDFSFPGRNSPTFDAWVDRAVKQDFFVKFDDDGFYTTPEQMREIKEAFGVYAEASRGTVSLSSFGLNFDHAINAREPVTVVLLRPNMVLLMNNALFFSDPGDETGSFLVAFPHTGVSTNQVNESMRMSMRIHIGCIIKRPENIIVLRHVQCAGFIKGHGVGLAETTDEFLESRADDDDDERKTTDLVLMAKLESTPWSNVWKDPLWTLLAQRGPYGSIMREKFEFLDGGGREWPDHGDVEVDPAVQKTSITGDVPVHLYRGTVCNGRGEIVLRNNGHLGPLDNPACCGMIAGQQRYGEIPRIMESGAPAVMTH